MDAISLVSLSFCDLAGREISGLARSRDGVYLLAQGCCLSLFIASF